MTAGARPSERRWTATVLACLEATAGPLEILGLRSRVRILIEDFHPSW